MIPSEVPPGIDPDAAFTLSVQISQFLAKMDDGSSLNIPRKLCEWIVDYRYYTMDTLEKDLAARVNWGNCQHLIIITTRNPKMEDFLHPFFSVYHFRLAYAGIIKPLPDKSQWPRVELGYRLLPPLAKRGVGRQRKNRIPGCLENKGSKPRTKGAWRVQCSTCFQRGHRSSSPKCPMNGTKKRKSRAKVGRPLGSGKEDATTSAPKRQKKASQTGAASGPGPVTRSQTEVAASPGPVTRSQTREGTSSPGPMSTPTKSPAKKRAVKKKLTPRKPKN